MVDNDAADVSGFMIIFVVVILIIRYTIINKQLNAQNVIIIS
jgi:hypothetical protein